MKNICMAHVPEVVVMGSSFLLGDTKLSIRDKCLSIGGIFQSFLSRGQKPSCVYYLLTLSGKKTRTIIEAHKIAPLLYKINILSV